MSLIASDQFRIVVGLGKSGMSLVRFLANRGIAFAVADTREQPPELDTLRREYPQVEVRCGELDVDFLCRANELYVSPGLALATPALQQAAARGVKLSGDIELFARHAKAPIIAISGSNAKNITDHLAVLRPHCWLMIGHCGGLRQSQTIGDYVLAHAYMRRDGILDSANPMRIIGVLDWEMATIGDPLMDLGN
ncbi:MAG: phosphotransferase, partial [Pseudomonas sp.]|nr:phosphotransferase [Pseudomonas sp.]